MSALFFDHLVIKEELEFELNSYQLSAEDKDDLIAIIDTTLTHHVLNVLLNYLPKELHEEFIAGFQKNPDDVGHLNYLKSHAHPEIEKEIKKIAAKVKSEILTEIRKHRKKK
jgi:hypothetical protein